VDAVSGISGAGDADVSATGGRSPSPVSSLWTATSSLPPKNQPTNPSAPMILRSPPASRCNRQAARRPQRRRRQFILEAGSMVIAAEDLEVNAGFNNVDECGDDHLSPVTNQRRNNLEICVLGDLPPRA